MGETHRQASRRRDVRAGLERRRTDRGMTLVEVLAVVVILGLIAGTLMVSFSGTFGKAKRELAKTSIANVVGKLEAYRIEKNGYPPSDAGLAVLVAPAANPSNAFYLPSDKLLDPWGRQFLYVVPGPGGEPFEVISLGADGKQGGIGEDEDLSSAHLRDEVTKG
jgi:general secretion pathway protein G